MKRHNQLAAQKIALLDSIDRGEVYGHPSGVLTGDDDLILVFFVLHLFCQDIVRSDWLGDLEALPVWVCNDESVARRVQGHCEILFQLVNDVAVRVALGADESEVALLRAGLRDAVQQTRVMMLTEAKTVNDAWLIVVRFALVQEILQLFEGWIQDFIRVHRIAAIREEDRVETRVIRIFGDLRLHVLEAVFEVLGRFDTLLIDLLEVLLLGVLHFWIVDVSRVVGHVYVLKLLLAGLFVEQDVGHRTHRLLQIVEVAVHRARLVDIKE